LAVRQRLVTTSLRMAEERPWMGSGLGTWVLIYPQYATFDPGVLVNAAHCDWAQWAVEGGFPFAAWIAILMASVSRQALRSVWGLGVVAVAIHSFSRLPHAETDSRLDLVRSGRSFVPDARGQRC
jgi:hypothetical protein